MLFPDFVIQYLCKYMLGGTYIMAHVISDACISCGTCVDDCPVSAISMGDDHYEIDAGTCIDCGQCEDSCPNEAISAE